MPKVFNHLVDIKNLLGLSKSDTVFAYCQRTGRKLFVRHPILKEKQFKVFHDHKGGIGV